MAAITISPAQSLPSFMEPDNFDDRNSINSIDSQSLNSYLTVGAPIPSYVTEFGRQYLAGEAELYLPSDHDESRRQNLQFWLLKALFGGTDVFAPVTNPTRILDIGCGTGKWCQEVALKFPDAKVIGSDIHPHVDDQIFADNVEIVSEDANDGDWGDHAYSYIHTRQLAGAFSNFRSIVNRAYDYIEPGGWMESQELYPVVYCDDDTLKPDNQFLEWSKLLDEAWMGVGRPIRTGNKLKGWYERAGFTDVHEEVYKIPVNEWPKDPKFKTLGRFHCISLREGVPAFSFKAFNEHFGWEHEETEVFLAGVKEAMADKRVHYYYNVYVVWGKKPENAEMRSLPG